MKTVKYFEFTINGQTFDNFDFEMEAVKINPESLLFKLAKAGCSEIHLQDKDAEDIYALYTQTIE